MTILITGAGGFLGRYVVEALREAMPNATLHGLDLPGVTQSGVLDSAHVCDLSECDAVSTALRVAPPRVVVHLAGLIQSRDRKALWRANVTGTENLLAALPEPPERIVQVSSSAVYGVPELLPVSESHPTSPTTPYGQSMLGREKAAVHWARAGSHLAILRLFNLCGPGQAPNMMVCAFARQIALIEAGRQEPRMVVGRLDTRRELIDVRDVAAAVVAAVACPVGELEETLNVCTGLSRQGQEVLQLLLAMSTHRPEVEQVAQEGRADDVLDLRGDPTTILCSLGWAPQIALEQTLRDVLQEWRAHVTGHEAH